MGWFSDDKAVEELLEAKDDPQKLKEWQEKHEDNRDGKNSFSW
jgi:macrodomain Ter protein organizer (MatP/YcbG family)